MPSKALRILLLFVIISSCKSDKEEKQLPLLFENKTIEKTNGENCQTKDYECTSITLELLRAEGPEEVTRKINQTLEDYIIKIVSTEEDPSASSLEELAEDFIANQQKSAQEFSEEMPWRTFVNTSLYSQTEHLLSIGIDAEVFTGGAHGYRSLSFLNFDPATGTQLSHEDIFTEGFTEYAESVFRKKQGIPSEENINSTGFWFEEDKFHLPNNIGFEEDKIILVYNPYEIASYANGEVYMEIPKEEVRTFLKPEEK